MNTIRVCVSINNKDFLFFDTIIFDNIFCFLYHSGLYVMQGLGKIILV